MKLPKLSASQVAWAAGEVAQYIDNQRRKFGRQAEALTNRQKELVHPFFAAPLLESVRLVVLKNASVENPPFYALLKTMGFDSSLLPDFSDMGAITFVDVIVSNGTISSATLFHELVHVVQYGKLGLAGFAEKYVTGFLRGGSYEHIPLEVNAYQLDAEYTRDPARHFSVDERVQKWVDQDKF